MQNQILLHGISVNDLLEMIGQVIDKKIGQEFQQPQEKNRSGFISRKEACKLLKITYPTLHEWTKSGVIPSYRIGARILFKADELEQAVKARNFTTLKRGGSYGK